MSTLSKQILFSPGRIVQGSLYKAQDKDMDGRPRVFPPGHPKAGQPKISYFFAVAIAKQPGETAWWDTAWGKAALELAQAAWPQGQWQSPGFAWKIEDGDSQVPNKRGRKNANTEGMAGCWIVNFSSGFAPKVFLVNPPNPPQPMIEPDVVKLGYWVEVLGTMRGNDTATNPGIYVNHDMVGFRGRDKEIFTGPDASTVGFGQSALPSHVSMAPVAAPGGLPAQVPAGAPAVPGMPATATPPPVPGSTPTPHTPAPAVPTSVAPNSGFITPPAPGAAPAVPPATPAPPAPPPAPTAPAAPVADPAGAPAGHRMTNAAGPRYEAYRVQGWTDAQLIANNHMVRL